jgi:hypothetical protein
MVAAKSKAITGMPKKQYNYKKLQNKEEGLSLLLESNLSFTYPLAYIRKKTQVLVT